MNAENKNEKKNPPAIEKNSFQTHVRKPCKAPYRKPELTRLGILRSVAGSSDPYLNPD